MPASIYISTKCHVNKAALASLLAHAGLATKSIIIFFVNSQYTTETFKAASVNAVGTVEIH